MQFKLATIVALLASVASPALAGSEGDAVESAIDRLAGKVVDTTRAVQKLSLLNFPSQFGSIASGYKEILELKNKQVSEAPQGIEPSSEPEVCNAFIAFSEIEKYFLENLIGKHGVLEEYRFSLPVASLIRADQSISDVYYLNILGLVPSCKDDLKAKGEQLKDLFNTALRIYSS